MNFQDAVNCAGLTYCSGKQALANSYKKQVTVTGSCIHTGSIDLDGHFAAAEPEFHRWDYGCGFNNGAEFAIWLEPHPASSGKEVDVVLRKLEWLKNKLELGHFAYLADLTKATQVNDEIPFRWLYSGKMLFKRGGKEEKRLAAKGMKLPERKLSIG